MEGVVKPVVVSMWASVISWFTPTILFCVLNIVVGIIIYTSSFKNNHHKEDDQHQTLVRVPSLLNRVRSINFSIYKFDHHIDETLFQTMDTAHSDPSLTRAPSLLERFRSMKFQPKHNSEPAQESEPEGQPQTQLARTPSLLERFPTFKFSNHRSQQPDPFSSEVQHVDSQDHERSQTVQSSIEPETRESNSYHPVVIRSSSNTRKESLKNSSSAKMDANAVEKDDVEPRRPATVRETKKTGNGTSSFGEDEEVDAKADDFINRFRQQLKLQRLDSLMRYKELLKRGAE